MFYAYGIMDRKMKNDFDFMLPAKQESRRLLLKRGTELNQRLAFYCFTYTPPPPLPQALPVASAKEYACRQGVKFDLIDQILQRLSIIPEGEPIDPGNFIDLADRIKVQIAAKEKLQNLLINQYLDVIATSKQTGNKVYSLRCALLISNHLKRGNQWNQLSQAYRYDEATRYYFKRFQENIRQRSLYRKYISGYFWVRCQFWGSNVVYLHLNVYINDESQKLNIMALLRDVWEHVTTEEIPGKRNAVLGDGTRTVKQNCFHSMEPGGILFYTKDKHIFPREIFNQTMLDIGGKYRIVLPNQDKYRKPSIMIDDLNRTPMVIIKQNANAQNPNSFKKYIEQLAKGSCILPWSDTFAASKIAGSIKK